MKKAYTKNSRLVDYFFNSMFDFRRTSIYQLSTIAEKMNDIGGEYKADSLPIDVDPYYQPTDHELEQLPPEIEYLLNS